MPYIFQNRLYKAIKSGSYILIASLISAFGLSFFVFTNNFAPAGVDGVSTMLQSLSGLNAGYFILIINIPLLVLGWFVINRKYIIYTVIFTLLNSLFLIIIPHLNINYNMAGKNEILDALFAGIVLGFRIALMLKVGGSTGGLDIIAAIIGKKLEYINFDKLLFYLNIVIVGSSFFVYGFNLYPVMLSIIYCFVYSKVIDMAMQGSKCALEFTVIAKQCDELINEIIQKLRHGVTVIEVQGGYTGDNKNMLKCIVNKREIAEFKKITKKYNVFCYITEVKEVEGNFRRYTWEEAK